VTHPPLVSIITPTFNPGHRLTRCIESIEAQSYPHVEHIVVDGGSTDGTLDVLRCHPGVRWVSEPDNGQSDALNKGFRMARGQLLTWINADDTLLPKAVESVVDAATATGAEWIYGNCKMWEGERSHLWDPPATFDEASFDWVCPIAQQGTFFTKRAFESVGGIDESYDLSMDYDLWLRFVKAGVARTFVPEVLGTFEVHEESKTGSRGHQDFMREGAVALRRFGRVEASDLMVGRAAAERAAQPTGRGPLVATARIRSELQRVKASHPELAQVRDAMAMKGAFAQAADIELRQRRRPAHLSGLRHLFRPAPWRDRRTRAAAKADLRVAAVRTLERLGRRK
jgi:Glycosyl transferase family 2